MHLHIPSTLGRQREELLHAAPRHKMVQVARVTGRQRDPRRHPPVLQRLAIGKLNHRPRWNIERKPRPAQPHPAQVIAPPFPLRRQFLAHQVAQEEARRGIVLLVAVQLREGALVRGGKRMRKLPHRRRAQRLQCPQRDGLRHWFRPWPFVIGDILPIRGHLPRVAPLHPPKLVVDPAQLLCVPADAAALPPHRHRRGPVRQRTLEKRRQVLHHPRRNTFLVHLHRHHMPARTQRRPHALVFRMLHGKPRRALRKIHPVHPHHEPGTAQKPQLHLGILGQFKTAAKRDMVIRLIRLHLRAPHRMPQRRHLRRKNGSGQSQRSKHCRQQEKSHGPAFHWAVSSIRHTYRCFVRASPGVSSESV